MTNIQINDWVEVLKPDLNKYRPSAPVAHFGRVVSTDQDTSEVVIEIWGRPNSCTNYFPLRFANNQLIKIQ